MDSLRIQFRELLARAPDATLVVSELGEIVFANQWVEPLLGWSSHELENQPLNMLVPDMSVEKHNGYVEHFFKQPHLRPLGTHTELVAKKKSGELVNVTISLSPVKINDGYYAITAIRDITRIKNLEDDLRLSRDFNSLAA